MSREIDERVVAMYFENSDFERSAGKTLKTLGKLREESDLSGSAKGFETLQQAAKKLNLDGVRRSAESLKNSLGGVGNVIGKAFKVGSAPLRGLENLFSTFRSYAAKFIGFDLAGKFVSSMENALRQLTVAPIQEGFAQYEQRMDSVKTIMSGSGEELDVVNAKLSKLTEYANKTIYSLSDMTSNIGKFTNNGVKLDQATDAMMGIANATALAGQGAQQASMAMYNISQAIGVGAMTTIDWKSIENANIATQQLKKTFMDVAVAKGTLVKKTEKDKKTGEEVTKYYVKGFEKGKKAVEVSVNNFRETLNKKWLDSATLTETFSIMSGQYSEAELQRMGYTEKEAKAFFELGQEAMKAATEVRTFHKMWDALRESVQAGWATSMEYILGDVNEATALWTSLSDTFGGILDKNAETRNEILLAWRGLEKQEDGTLKRVSRQDGRELMIRSLRQLIRIGERIGGIFTNAWESVAGKMTGERLYKITERISAGVAKMARWLGVASDKNSRLSKLTKTMSGLFTVIKMAGKVLKTVLDLGIRILGPVADGIIDLFGKLGEFITGLGDLDPAQILEKVGSGLGSVWEKVKSFFSPAELYDDNGTKTMGEPPFVTALRDFWEGLKETVRNWAADHGLDKAWEAFKKLVKPTVDAIGQFLQAPLEWISSQFSRKKRYDDRGFELNDDRAPVEVFLGDIFSKIETAWNAVKNWEFWGEVGSFLSNTWGWIKGQFTQGTAKDVDERGNVSFRTTASPVESFLQNILASIQSGWNAVVNWEFWSDVGAFIGNTWAWIQGRFAPTTVKDVDEKGNVTFQNGKSPVESFLQNVLSSVRNGWNAIVKWEFWGSVGTFLSNTWEWIKTTFGVARDFMTKENGDGQTGFSEWLNSVWEKIVSVWDSIKGWNVWNTIGTFLTNTWGWIKARVAAGRDFMTKENENGETGFSLWIGLVWSRIESAWNAVKELAAPVVVAIGKFVNDTWNWIVDEFGVAKEFMTQPNEEGETGFTIWLKGIWDKITGIWNSIVSWEGWAAIGTFVTNTWGWIKGLFQGSETSTAGAENGPAELVTQVADQMSESLEKLENAEGDTKQGATLFQKIMEGIGGFFEKAKELAHEVVGVPELERFFTALGEVLKVIFTKVTEALELISRIGNGQGTAGDWAVVGIGILLVVLAKVGEVVNNKYLSKVDGGTDFASKFIKIAGGILIMAAAVALLGALPTDMLKKGGIAVAALGAIVTIITLSIAKMYKENKKNPTTVAERIIGGITGAIEKVGMVAVAMALLPPIIEKIGEVRKMLGKDGGNIGEDMIGTMTGLVIAVAGIGAAMALLQKLTGSKGLSIAAAAKTMGAIIVVTAEIIAAFTAGGFLASLLNEDGVSTLLRGLDVLSQVFGKIGDAIGSLFGGLFGGFTNTKSESERTNFEKQLDWLSEISTKLNTKNIEKILDITDVMTRITDSTHNMNYNDAQLLITLIAGEAGVMGLAEAFATFIEKMNNVAIRDDIDLDRLRDTCLALSTLTGPIESLADSKDSWWSLTDIADGILSLANGLAYGGEGLEGFGAAGTEHYNKLMAALDVFGMFTSGVGKLGGLERSNLIDMVNWVNDIAQDKKLTEFSTNLHKIINELGSEGDAGIQFDGLSIVAKLYEAIQNGLKDPSLPAFDASGITDAIIAAIGLEEARINLAIQGLIDKALEFKNLDEQGGQTIDYSEANKYEEMARKMEEQLGSLSDATDESGPAISIRVVPVLDTEALTGTVATAEQLLKDNPILMHGFHLGGTSLDLGASMNNVVSAIGLTNEKLDSLIGIVKDGNTDRNSNTAKIITGLDGVEKSFGRAKVWIDGKALVGAIIAEIDRELYNRYILAGQVYS